MRRALAALLGPLAALVAAGPAVAAEVNVKGLDTLVWDKPEVTVAPGDKVIWTFDGTVQPHNVKGNSPNWADFRSTTGAPAPPAERVFDAPGIYDFVCEVHANTMIGRVTVTAPGGAPPPPPPPPPLSEQPFANDGGAVTVYETGGPDETRPRVSAVAVRRQGRGARVSFRLSEPARVQLRLTRGKRRVTVRRSLDAGRRSLSVRRLRAGRYAVEVRARDAAGLSGRATGRITIR